MKVRQGLLKFVSPQAQRELRLKAAKEIGSIDPPLPPEDRVTILFILSHDRDPEVSSSAKKALGEANVSLLCDALDKKLDPLVIRNIVSIHKGNEAVLIMAALNPSTDDETLKAIAETGPEEVVTLLSEDKEKLLKKPFILEGLKKNPLTPPTLIGGLEHFLANPVRSVPGESLDAAQNPSATPVSEELVEGLKRHEGPGVPQANKPVIDEQNMYKLIQGMGVGSKVKLALTGNKSARELLVKDSNKIIAMSVLKNPRMTEDEVLRLSSIKGIAEDILRHIAKNKEWIKNYSIKYNMITNAKTPLPMSLKMLDSLFDKDLSKIAKSKNVPSALASAARRKIEAKQKH